MYRRKSATITELHLPSDIVAWIDAEVEKHSAEYEIDRAVVIETIMRAHIDRTARASSGQKRGPKPRTRNGASAHAAA